MVRLSTGGPLHQADMPCWIPWLCRSVRPPPSFNLPGVHLDRRCSQPLQCPCCGACFATWTVSKHGQPTCPHCGVVDRHRAVCYDLITDPPARLLEPGAFVAYWGPTKAHVAALQGSSPQMHLQEFDVFSTGYPYTPTTVRADLQDVPLQDNTVDGVILLHVLEHVPHLHQALGELARVLRPGGFLLSETPCYPSYDHEATWSRAPDGTRWWTPSLANGYENCTAAREYRAKHASAMASASEPLGYLCAQSDHAFGYRCDHLIERLRAHHFECSHAPKHMSLETAKRHLGPAVVSADVVHQLSAEGRVRCYARSTAAHSIERVGGPKGNHGQPPSRQHAFVPRSAARGARSQ